MATNIKLSEEHGVNPSVMQCPVCGQDTGLALFGKLKGDAKAPKYSIDREPCKDCCAQFDEYKNMGFVLFGIDDEYDKVDKKEITPWQMFREVHVIKQEAAERMFDPEMRKAGAMFINQGALRNFGIPAPTEKVSHDKEEN